MRVLIQSDLRNSGPLAENIVMVFQCYIGPLHHHDHLKWVQIWLTMNFQRTDRGLCAESKGDSVCAALDRWLKIWS